VKPTSDKGYLTQSLLTLLCALTAKMKMRKVVGVVVKIVRSAPSLAPTPKKVVGIYRSS
jgi:hypothetical protein